MLVMGLFGLLGNMLRKPKLVQIYSISVLCSIPVYFSLSIASAVAPTQILPSNNCIESANNNNFAGRML